MQLALHRLYIFVPTDNVLKVPVTSRDPLDTTGHLARVGDGAHDIAAASEGNVRHLMCKLGIFDQKFVAIFWCLNQP